MHKHFPHSVMEVRTLTVLNKKKIGNPTDIHVNTKEDALFLEGLLSQLIGGQEQWGTSPKEVVDSI
jgi:hypothetical protein